MAAKATRMNQVWKPPWEFPKGIPVEVPNVMPMEPHHEVSQLECPQGIPMGNLHGGGKTSWGILMGLGIIMGLYMESGVSRGIA